MLERLSKNHRNIALVVIALVLGWFAWTVRAVLNPLILGYLLAYILRPLVARLEERGMRRRAAVNIIFALAGVSLLVLLGGVFVQGRQFVDSQLALAQRGEDPFSRVEKNLDGILGRAGGWFDAVFGEEEPAPGSEPAGGGAPEDDGEAPPEGGDAAPGVGAPEDGGGDPGPDGPGEGGAPDDAPAEEGAGEAEPQGAPADVDPSRLTVRELVRAWVADWNKGNADVSGFDKARVLLGYVQRVFGGVLSVLGFLVLLPVYTYFLLFELERIHDFVRAHVPKKERERVTRIGRSVGQVIANFFRGRLLISVLKGLVIALGLTLLGVPYGFLLGMLAGALSLVPFVGPTIGFLLTELVELQQMDGAGGASWVSLALIAGVFALAEFLEGYVFIPKILGDSLGLHPVVILVSVFVGGAALGLFGFLIAIPLAATLIILFRELVMPAIEDFAEEDSHVDEAPGRGAGG